MKCIVVGGSGFIGSHLVDHLLAAGHDTTVVDLRKPVQDVPWIEKDIRSDLGDAFDGAETVFHLAALANARRCSDNPELCFETNVGGTLRVLKAARQADIDRLFIASTVWVAGAQEGDHVKEESLFHIPNVNTVYGASKLSQEMLCHSFRSEYGGPDCVILRYGIPYGERMWKGLVIRAFMDMAERGGTINIMGDGKQSRPFLYVGDLCQAHVAILENGRRNGVFNLPGDRMINVEELALEVVKHFPADLDFIPQARVEPKLKTISGDLARADLGWSPTTSLAEGIQCCADWWKALDGTAKAEGYWC